jgi:hypothetical protein
MARNFRLGKHLSLLQVYGGTIDVAGVITWTLLGTLQHRVDYIRPTFDPNLEMVISVDDSQASYETTYKDSSMTIGEIETNDDNGVLTNLVSSYDLAKVRWKNTTGGSLIGQYIGRVRNSLILATTAFGKNASELTLAPYYDGTTTPMSWS